MQGGLTPVQRTSGQAGGAAIARSYQELQRQLGVRRLPAEGARPAARRPAVRHAAPCIVGEPDHAVCGRQHLPTKPRSLQELRQCL